MELQRDYFLGQLLSLKITEEHLKSLAIYTRTFSSSHETIIEGLEYANSRSSIHHKLGLYYLINEILVNEKSPNSSLRLGLKRFIVRHFQPDKQLSHMSETLHKKFVELENIWKAKNIVDFEDDYSVEEIVYKIKEYYTDKKALVSYLSKILDHLDGKINK